MPRVLKAAVTGYLLGTIPSADLAARAAAKRSGGAALDVRSEGSGNPGATNVNRLLGAKYGLMVMAADIAKGTAAGFLGRAQAGATGAHVGSVAAVVGHCFPVWNGFRGGKGVATSVGQCIATFPVYAPANLAVAAATTAVPGLRRERAALTVTAVSSAVWVGGGVWWWRKHRPNLWGPRPTVLLPIANAASSAVVIYRFVTSRPPKPAPTVTGTPR